MRIATWNINSVRIRLAQLKKLVDEARPDVVCLQETKVEDTSFPLESLKALGFPHIAFSGQKSYNGVAILSKLPLSNIECMPVVKGSDHKRHISATLPNDITVHNYYVPAGGDIPDREQNPAYGFKLDFVDAMKDWSSSLNKKQKIILVGDLNIAPLEHDVWSSKQLRDVVSHTAPERERLTKLLEITGWCDAGRHFIPQPEKLYSWWSYRNRDWKKSDRGRRLDHIWVTPALKASLKSYETLRHARDWDSPSDHVPLIAELA
ncbi:MAG: exodeoxyribonuclease III [Rickettsiales bacterium]|jgi:exodeoxyribonuclease-3|nr:exodeoxyribonuclease III [Rickettsiales bacterium]